MMLKLGKWNVIYLIKKLPTSLINPFHRRAFWGSVCRLEFEPIS